MSIEQHTSVLHAESFAPQFFFTPYGETDEEYVGIENLQQQIERSKFYRMRAHEILDKARTGWTREGRRIPKEYWETV